MNHSRMDGITCLCGEREWRPLIVPQKEDVGIPILMNARARHIYALLGSMTVSLQIEVVKHVLSDRLVFEEIKQWVNGEKKCPDLTTGAGGSAADP